MPFAALLALLLAASPGRAQEPRPTLVTRTGPDGFLDRPVHRARFGADDPRLAGLRSAGAVRWELDYGAFVLAGIDERAGGGAAALRVSGIEWRDELDLVYLQGVLLDPQDPGRSLAGLDPREVLGDPLASGLVADAGLYLLQFRGPIRDGWRSSFVERGVEFVQHVPRNAYVVRVAPDDVAGFESLARAMPEVAWCGVYHPAFRMTDGLRRRADEAEERPVAVTVQLVDGPLADAAEEDLGKLGTTPLAVTAVGPYRNVRCDVPPAYLRWLAAHPAVFALEERGERRRNDERQAVIVSGNVSGGVPAAPTYLQWLVAKGFGPGQFGSFSINVVDDATTLKGHPDLASARVTFTRNPTGQTGPQGGHGFLNAQILAGLNSLGGTLYQDPAGYNYGLGVAPWARVGSTAVFGPAASSAPAWESAAHNLGARISTNSWTYADAGGGPIADYDTWAQEYDFIVRDARAIEGNQEYTVVFSAGNDGPTANSVSSPATAKNVITVGASESLRQTGTDGCGIVNALADDLRDLSGFSSRGPVDPDGGDGRFKPDLTAPGTHIQGGVPQANYDGSSVCNKYFPAGQTLYGWSSGTSHAAPAVAGGCALVRQWFLNQGRAAPSPAMVKAVLVASAEYLTGAEAADDLPSNAQGFGRMFLKRAFDTVPRRLFDQGVLFGEAGQTFTTTGTIADPAEPVRVTLVWTDAPGPTTGAPWGNDLDLTVQTGTATYLGNVFAGDRSVVGGSADFRNNVESVFLPAGLAGPLTVTVTASAIGADGVPGNTDLDDQDFALVVYNIDAVEPPRPEFAASPLTGAAPLTVAFGNLSAGQVTSHHWSFGDGVTSTEAAPLHTYVFPGTYTVTLTETGPGGSDARKRTGYVVVSEPPPSVDFTGTPTTGIFPLTVAFQNRSSGAVSSHAWTFGDGGTSTRSSPSHTYEFPGTYTVSLTETGPGGATTATREAYVTVHEAQPVAGYIGTPRVGPAPLTVSFANQSTGLISSHAWDFGDGATSALGSPSHVYETPGSYSVSLTESGPGGSDTYTRVDYVTVQHPPPAAEFLAAPTTGPAPLDVLFTNLSSGDVTAHAWDFGDGSTSTEGSPAHTYAQPGLYSVTLTETGPGGTDTVTMVDLVEVTIPPPAAEFSADPTVGENPLLVSFTNLTAGAVTSYAWDFGDGATSTEAAPSHVYTAPGSFTVSLTATGPTGIDTSTKQDLVTVLELPPVAAFEGTPTLGTAPLTVSFTDQSTGKVTSVLWDLGDGSVSAEASPTHVYADPGTYTVSVTVTGPGGSDTLTRVDYVTVEIPAPTANFVGSPRTGTGPLAVSFSDRSSGDVTSWSWDFGDGGTSSSPEPEHVYTVGGLYAVSLTATGPGGSDTRTRAGYVDVAEPEPTAALEFRLADRADPLRVQFTDRSLGAIRSWLWDFGDGTTSTERDPSHVYGTSGRYDVTLTVTSDGGTDDCAARLTLVAVTGVAGRNGGGTNPVVYSGPAPKLGSTWSATVDLGLQAGGGSSTILFKTRPASGLHTRWGELLLDPTAPVVHLSRVPLVDGVARHRIDLPDDLALGGLELTSQALVVTADGAVLTNALDLVLLP